MAQLLRDFVKVENDFTIIPNEILRNKEMKSSTKNILLTMFSLPPNWDFSIAGIATCVKEGYETVQKSLVELEKVGYITRTREHKEDGTFGAMIYTIHQFPVSEEKNTYKNNHSNQDVKNPKQVKANIGKYQDREIPLQEKQGQLSTDSKLNKDFESIIDDELSIDNRLKTKEDKTLSNDNGEVKTSFSEKPKKDVRTKTALEKYLGKKADEQDMLKRLANICISNYDEKTAKEIFETIEHYFRCYTDKTGLIHPILKDETLIRITEKMDCFYDSEYSHFERLIGQDHAFMKMVDMFFDGDFGAVKGHETNYHLPAFMTDGILNKLGQRLFDLGEVE